MKIEITLTELIKRFETDLKRLYPYENIELIVVNNDSLPVNGTCKIIPLEDIQTPGETK